MTAIFEAIGSYFGAAFLLYFLTYVYMHFSEKEDITKGEHVIINGFALANAAVTFSMPTV